MVDGYESRQAFCTISSTNFAKLRHLPLFVLSIFISNKKGEKLLKIIVVVQIV